MKLPRPHIPLHIRVAVASGQLRHGHGVVVDREVGENDDVFLDRLLGHLAYALTGKLFTPLHLDHDPALCNRKFNNRTGKYKPDANDPKFLIYRTTEGHDIKTRVRGDGAQLSDLAMLRKNKRIAKRILTGKRPKYG